MMNVWNDKVLRAMFAFAIGVVFVVIQFASNDTNPVLLAMGVVWCFVSLYWTVTAIKMDWKE